MRSFEALSSLSIWPEPGSMSTAANGPSPAGAKNEPASRRPSDSNVTSRSAATLGSLQCVERLVHNLRALDAECNAGRERVRLMHLLAVILANALLPLARIAARVHAGNDADQAG
jgi:hypothetical protein